LTIDGVCVKCVWLTAHHNIRQRRQSRAGAWISVTSRQWNIRRCPQLLWCLQPSTLRAAPSRFRFRVFILVFVLF